MAEWFERFFEGSYARVLPNTFSEETTLEHARIVKRLLRARRGQTVLDIPCGTGRVTLPLAEMGLAMTGVDLTAPYLARARREARRRGLDVRFMESDMRDIAFEGEFTGAFNWFGSFGYFSDADNLAFCRSVFEALKPGGRFLVEGLNKSWLVSHLRPTDESEIAGVRISTRHRWDDRTGRIHGAWTFRKGATTERRRSSMRLFNGAEIRGLLRAAGFREIVLYGYPPVARFTRHSRRMIAVGRKPQS